ncbi:MAG: hypothetical protein HRT72_06700, partial [Flavobacteriales bacterium]|nr:hypothetical protein [Flavobacteriales bacterium]
MSKRKLKKYLDSLEKEQLQDQVLELYSKFKPVKVFYDFVFNPKEDRMLTDCKLKILKEYFPLKKPNAKRKVKVKARRSVAKKHIKHFIQLGVDP